MSALRNAMTLLIKLFGLYGIGMGAYLVHKREMKYGWRGQPARGRIVGLSRSVDRALSNHLRHIYGSSTRHLCVSLALPMRVQTATQGILEGVMPVRLRRSVPGVTDAHGPCVVYRSPEPAGE
jgi:hypothetical protein